MSILYKKLALIHADILNRFEYVPDEKLWRMKEHWESPEEIPDKGVLKGDCDCFALACRKECRKASLSSRLVLCAVYDDNGKPTGHLVLESNGWILCCNQPRPIPNTELHYEWISISGYGQGEPWHYIHPDKRLWSKIIR